MNGTRTGGGQVYVSFSGGKDSTVLLDLVRRIYPDVPAVYSDTGLEYPELRTFVKGQDNVEIIKPEKTFREIVKNYGYPLISKEVAEAIYYARRLGGGKTTIRKQLELQGKRRDSKPMRNEPNCWDNRHQQLANNSENNLGGAERQ